MEDPGTLTLTTSRDTLRFDRESGRLVSFRSGLAPDQEFIAGAADHPACVVQYLGEDGRYAGLSSRAAERVQVDSSGEELHAAFHRLGGVDLDVTITVHASSSDPASRWRVGVDNRSGLAITDVQFPFIVCPYHLAGRAGAEKLLWPFGAGVLLKAPEPQDLGPDHSSSWQFSPGNGDFAHYPGYTVAQFLAYYNDRAGILVFCEDDSGRIKLIRPLHRSPGLRLGFAHVGDWPARGSRLLEYAVALTSFQGDWHAAAEVDRAWSLGQSWASTPLARRADVPEWLLDSPPHLIIRLQGILDTGPAEPVREFLPYEKCIPLLDRVARSVGSPVLPVIMSWEKPGPWIYPECFPPVGGEESLRSMCALARERGWHVGSFSNGTRWVVGHAWTPYDGMPFFRQSQAERSVCVTPSGELWKETWDAGWRPSFACCLGAGLTREVAEGFVRKLVELGLDWIQFFDQNVGCATFPCFSSGHGHPPMPGLWMTERMRELLASFRRIGHAGAGTGGGERAVVFSVEGPVNEVYLREIHICDVRVVPPGHQAGPPGFGGGFVPLYHYLYHELVLIQGGFGAAPEPYHLPIRNAYNLVLGEIPGAVLQGDGVLLNKDTLNWAPWQPPVGRDHDSLAMLRSATALRRGAGRDFLVLGRMQRPARVTGVRIVRWQRDDRVHRIPAVFHEVWQAPGGRTGIVLANWTVKPQEVRVRDARLAGALRLWVSGKSLTEKPLASTSRGVALKLPPLGCALLATE